MPVQPLICNYSPLCDYRRFSQLVDQSFCLFQIGRVEPFGEPPVDRREKIAGLLPFALIAPQPSLPGHCDAYAFAIKGHRFDPTELDTLRSE
jgi:hypothetical protein